MLNNNTQRTVITNSIARYCSDKARLRLAARKTRRTWYD